MSDVVGPGPSFEQRVALYEIAQVLGGRTNLADVFETVVERLGAHVAFDFAALMVLDAEPDMERVVGWYPPDSGAGGQMYRRNRSRYVLAEQFREGTEWKPSDLRDNAAAAMAEGGLTRAWSVPLMGGDEYFGVVTLARLDDDPFEPDDLGFLRAAGRLFAAAAREEHSIWKADRDAARSAVLTDLMVLLNEGRPVDELFDRLVALLGQAVRFDHASLFRSEPEGTLRLMAEHPRRETDAEPGFSVIAKGMHDALAQGNRWLQFDFAERETGLARAMVRNGLRMVNGIILQHMGKLVGALVLARERPQPFPDDDCEFLALAGTLLAQSMVNKERELQQIQLEQTARLSALGELVAGVAHELNNPLTAILGFTELLSSADAPAGIREDLALIHKESLRARDIVRDLLFLVRPGEIEHHRLTLGELVGHIQRLRQAAWTKQGIDVSIDVRDGDVPLLGNEHRLTQVLLNLTTNAEQALARVEQRTLAVRAWLDAENAVIEVEDSGPGIEPDVLGRIWEPFFTTKQGIGTGLGLTLSRSIVDSHGGHIAVRSAAGRGTTFRVEIPRAGRQLRVPGQGEARLGRRVLVVDDEPNLRKLARRLVETMGHECAVAEDVAEALELAQRDDFDLVLCDYRLGSSVGDEVVEGLLRVAPRLVARTVIATGAMTDKGVERLARRFGLRVLGKPYGADEIAGLLLSLEQAA